MAALAKVSGAAVSRYLNKKITLPIATAHRIDQAVLKLEYRPNASALGLSKGRTDTVGLVTPNIANPFFACLASAVEEEAAALGYSTVLCSTRSLRQQELLHLDRLASKQVDGLIVMTNHGHDGTLFSKFPGHSRIVLLGEDVLGMNVPKVLFDNIDGGFKATSYLISKGHTRIAHISGPEHLVSAQERFAGFRKACIEQRLSLDPSLLYFGTYSQSYGYEAMDALLSRPDPPTAVFAASDFIAIGILEAVQARGKNVPHDISLVGFDDIPLSNLLNPPLTTIHLPIVELGKTAVRLLHARIQDEPVPPATVRFPVSLLERSSVSAPRKTPTLKVRRARSNGRKSSFS